MRPIIVSIAASAALLVSCSTTPMDASTPAPARAAQCDADDLQQFVGQTATSEIGGRLLQMTGAETLRWVPPRSAVTMDYRPDRLTVTYTDDMIIERIECG